MKGQFSSSDGWLSKEKLKTGPWRSGRRFGPGQGPAADKRRTNRSRLLRMRPSEVFSDSLALPGNGRFGGPGGNMALSWRTGRDGPAHEGGALRRWRTEQAHVPTVQGQVAKTAILGRVCDRIADIVEPVREEDERMTVRRRVRIHRGGRKVGPPVALETLQPLGIEDCRPGPLQRRQRIGVPGRTAVAGVFEAGDRTRETCRAPMIRFQLHPRS